MKYTALVTMAELSQDLKHAGAPEGAYNAGYIIGFLLVIGIVVWLGVKAIKKIVTSGLGSKTKDQKNKMSTPMILGLIVGGVTIIALSVGVALPINSVARNVCVAIVGINISLVVILWFIGKLKTYFLYNNLKAGQEKQESKKVSKKKGKK